ncbi:MAG: glycoside hydrolase family 57 [Candidatus Contendobacter odensis]|uniref:Glycoside hydrolase family 57 n=1 Tax=Candidatus Contendibacter odensensis TaxID=1400860 RepID=A0A2G6PEC0_9GAMM|nr:MAG: glycoside hydrolase family 57 [Candidatus Contendobacter odensis]
MANTRYHALVLSLHQPHGNLDHLLVHDEWEAREILLAMDRIPRSLLDYQDVGRVNLALSGTLLETLMQSDFQSRAYGIVDCNLLLWHLHNTNIIDILGGAYYHPVMPLIPPADWDTQLERWKTIARRQFVNSDFQGFYPPDMGFCMEMIPLLRRCGYSFVMVDSEHVKPVTAMKQEALLYQPHIARFGDQEIIVVVRDHDLSSAQEKGMTFGQFEQEVQKRTRGCDFPPLVTTGTDGQNCACFRGATPDSNFWDVFYKPLIGQANADHQAIQPIFIKDYLDRFGASGEVTVGSGTWNTPGHGDHFVQWTGTPAQRKALTRVNEISQAVQVALQNAANIGSQNPELSRLLEEAHWRVLRAETSCNFFWGDAWVMRCHADLDQACEHLQQADAHFN